MFNSYFWFVTFSCVKKDTDIWIPHIWMRSCTAHTHSCSLSWDLPISTLSLSVPWCLGLSPGCWLFWGLSYSSCYGLSYFSCYFFSLVPPFSSGDIMLYFYLIIWWPASFKLNLKFIILWWNLTKSGFGMTLYLTTTAAPPSSVIWTLCISKFPHLKFCLFCSFTYVQLFYSLFPRWSGSAGVSWWPFSRPVHSSALSPLNLLSLISSCITSLMSSLALFCLWPSSAFIFIHLVTELFFFILSRCSNLHLPSSFSDTLHIYLTTCISVCSSLHTS